MNRRYSEVTVVRIYVSEGEVQLEKLLERLRSFEHLRGVTVFRGIAGFGDSGKVHSGRWMDLALDLPMVVEFYDAPHKVEAVLDHLGDSVRPGHLLKWNAQINEQPAS